MDALKIKTNFNGDATETDRLYIEIEGKKYRIHAEGDKLVITDSSLFDAQISIQPRAVNQVAIS